MGAPVREPEVQHRVVARAARGLGGEELGRGGGDVRVRGAQRGGGDGDADAVGRGARRGQGRWEGVGDGPGGVDGVLEEGLPGG